MIINNNSYKLNIKYIDYIESLNKNSYKRQLFKFNLKLIRLTKIHMTMNIQSKNMYYSFELSI